MTSIVRSSHFVAYTLCVARSAGIGGRSDRAGEILHGDLGCELCVQTEYNSRFLLRSGASARFSLGSAGAGGRGEGGCIESGEVYGTRRG